MDKQIDTMEIRSLQEQVAETISLLGGYWMTRIEALPNAWRKLGHGDQSCAIDRPNVVLRGAGHSIELEWMHGNTTWPDYLGLYVDHPHRLLTDLRANCRRVDENHLSENVADVAQSVCNSATKS